MILGLASHLRKWCRQRRRTGSILPASGLVEQNNFWLSPSSARNVRKPENIYLILFLGWVADPVCERLFVSQRDHGIRPHRPPRGDVRCRQRHEQENNNDKRHRQD